MTKLWVYHEDLILDYTELIQNNLPESDLTSFGLLGDAILFENDVDHILDYGYMNNVVETGFPSIETAADLKIAEHRSLLKTDSKRFIKEDFFPDELESDSHATSDTELLRSFKSGGIRPSAFAISSLIHVTTFCLLGFIPASLQAGAGMGRDQGAIISVNIAALEDLIPQDANPASIDSLASKPSIAAKAKKPTEKKIADSTEKLFDENDIRSNRITMIERPQTEEKTNEKKELNDKEKPDPTSDGELNSMASAPSVASAERQFIPAASRGHEAFKSMVLSAIKEAIFFPKAALKERQHGETVVAFVINRDGSVTDLRMEKSSGSKILDEAAIKIVQKAGKKFPPLPESIDENSLEYTVPIMFKK